MSKEYDRWTRSLVNPPVVGSVNIPCPECNGSGEPTRKHSDLATKCEDCNGTGLSDLKPINKRFQSFVVGGWPLTGEKCSKCNSDMVRNPFQELCSNVDCDYIKG